MPVLSIDLGTSNTVAVLSAHGRPPRVVEVDGSATMPSAVFAAEDGRLVVGREAERRARLDPARYEPNPKRRIDEGSLLLGDVVVPVVDALAAVLARVAEETARQLGAQRLDPHGLEVRLTRPARWGPARRGVLLGAGQRVFGNVTTVPEPVAAAAHYASFPGRLRQGQALAVYDLGAGTFDCAVVGATGQGFVVLAEHGLPDLGGLDVDQALTEHLGRQVSGRDPVRWQRLLRPGSTADRRAQRALREDVRAAKEALSRHQQADVPLPEPFPDALVTRAELEALIRPSLLRSVEVLAATVRAAALDPRSLAGIYLVGGSSRIPLIATLIGEHLHVVPTSLDQPETAVALGAHHVTHEGVAVRTGDLPRPPAPPDSRPTRHLPAVPRTVGPPAPAVQPVRPVQSVRAGGPAQAGRSGRSRRLIVVAAAVVLALAAGVAAVLLADRGDDLPAAHECFEPGDQDGEGFTRCLRQLAGAVADDHECTPGTGGASPQQTAGVSVNCVLDPRRQVVYTHGDTQGDASAGAQPILDRWASSTGNDRVEADWAGNGLRGRYVATVDDGNGLLAFGVGDRPLYGMLIVTGEEGLTPDALADYFERDVQPGT